MSHLMVKVRFLLTIPLLVLAVRYASAGSLTANGIIAITCSATASVSVTTFTLAGLYPYGVDTSSTNCVLNYGTCQTGQTCYAATPFYVWNISLSSSSAVQKYTLATTAATTNAAAGTPWRISTTWAVDVDSCAVAGCFDQTGINTGTVGANNIIDVGATQWQGAVYNNGTLSYTTTSHGNTTAGTPTAKQLWTAVKMPTAVSSNAAELITITVTAAMAG